jgi:hypothetical protein
MDESRKRSPDELRHLAAFAGKASSLDPADCAQRRHLAGWCERQASLNDAVWMVRRVAEPRRG